MKHYTKRAFLQTAAALPAALCLRTNGAEHRCPLSFGTYGLPGYTLLDSIGLVSDIGYDSIEFAAMPGYHGAPDQISKNERKDTAKALIDSGLALGALMGLPTSNQKKQAANTDWVKQLLELAHDLSPETPPMIQSVLGGGKWEEKKNLFRDCLGPWVELAAESGVTLAIKPHRGHAMNLPEQGVWLIEQLNATGKLRLVYDQSHFAFRDLPIEQTIATALPHTGYIVMKDAVQKDGKVRFALPGEAGTIDHAEILKSFLKGGYKGEICAEVSSQVWRSEGYDPRKAAKTCFENMAGIAAKALK